MKNHKTSTGVIICIVKNNVIWVDFTNVKEEDFDRAIKEFWEF